MEDLYRARTRLEQALKRNRSEKWCLFLWGKFIRLRDNNKCSICGSDKEVQAHHIFRKAAIKQGKYELGNGICLCDFCHREVHAEHNGRPDLSKPLNYEGGDDQDNAAYLYGVLYKKSQEIGGDGEGMYYLSDDLLHLFIRFQGYEEMFKLVESGQLSRIGFAHEIWRAMPQQFYTKLAASIFSGMFEES